MNITVLYKNSCICFITLDTYNIRYLISCTCRYGKHMLEKFVWFFIVFYFHNSYT